MIDLHSHSTCSDGSESPAHVIELAADAGLRAIALTDHDGLAGLEEAERRADELGIGFIPGCEVSCDFSPGSMHLLCYFVPPRSGPLQDALIDLRRSREQRNKLLVARLAELGVEVDPEEVAKEAGSAIIGRPHFAAVLVRNGAVSSIAEAFDRYLAKGAPAYVERVEPKVEEVIGLAHESGAVTVLAHPLSLTLGEEALDRQLALLREQGLDGLECYYSRYEPEVRDELALRARRYGLVPTGGSDFHGTFKPGIDIGTGTGDLSVPDQALDELTARHLEFLAP